MKEKITKLLFILFFSGVTTLTLAQGSVGNYIWFDSNRDNLQNEPASSGINGVSVELWSSSNSIVGDMEDVFVDVTVSADSIPGHPGYFRFAISATGSYYLKFPVSHLGDVLTGQDPNPEMDGNSDADINGFSPLFYIDTGGAGAALNNYTIDAGYMTCNAPAFSVSATDPSCGGLLSYNNGKIILSAVSNANRYDLSAGNAYVGMGYPFAGDLSTVTAGEIRTNMPNANSTQVYTIRLFGSGDNCHTDQNVTINPVPCGDGTLFIDDFSTRSILTKQTGTGTALASVPTGNGIGGELDVRHVITPSFVEGDVVETMGSELMMALNISHGATYGEVTLQWDGSDGNANTINYTGLGGLDITSGGKIDRIQFDLLSDFTNNDSLVITIELFTDFGAASEQRLVFYDDNGLWNTKTFFLSGFTPSRGAGAVMTSIGAIVMTIDATRRTGMEIAISGLKMPPISSFPVELKEFTARLSNTEGLLEWTTLSEANVSHFAVERSMDNGKSFEWLGNVQAAGNSNNSVSYEFRDKEINNLSLDKVFYRLKMIDIDNSFKYSNTAELSLEPLSAFLNLYPLPASSRFTVEYQLPDNRIAEIRILNSIGQEVYKEVHNHDKTLAVQKKEIHLKNTNPGIYFLEISSENKIITRKFIIK
ncbi:MAG: T9SS type A sorting domain-containing protein [Bacteroidia bacterium]|nr:T9SS type A sorting domain-containing protein [Bacteroidia bacterium]